MAGPTLFIRQQCPNATVDNDGLMPAQLVQEIASLTPSGQMILAIMNGPIGTSSAGAAAGAVVVPANWHSFRPIVISASIAPTASLLLPGNLALIDGNTFLFVNPDANGVYAVTPGQMLLVFFGYYNVSATDAAVGGENQATVTFTKMS